MSQFEIKYYHDYISESLANSLLLEATPVSGVEDLVEVGESGGLETSESLNFLVKVYEELETDLKQVLNQRIVDRKFIDERVKACCEYNISEKNDLLDESFKTIIGLEDSGGRVLLGPLNDQYAKAGGDPIAPIPDFLKGPHVTLFGPPDSVKMSINAMNAYHRKIEDEPKIVEELLKTQTSTPKWGADDEDSKTPLRKDLMEAAVNLTACLDGTLKIEGQSKYKLEKDNLAVPIKRFPGLALPSTFLFYKGNPIPLHLYDFVLHLYKNWQNPKALVFYVPKLENEEEAKYIHKMISVSESMIKSLHKDYVLGSVRLMIVLENPRAIVRTHEIMDALYPYFVGASLGWHDYLGSTARVFKEDSHYRIPVKADPDIVIKYIKASHLLLANVVGSRGGIKVGGMYGILPLENDLHSESFQATILGFIKDVVTQMKRDLTGYWVAHPDFVRLGLAIVEAWKIHSKGDSKPLEELVKSLLANEHHKDILEFIYGDDIEDLDLDDPNYVRSLIVADIKESDFIANNHPDEIRYNVFQSLQYITDWLSGNGCVALPAIVKGIPVRVMDDLATAERSRWEVWHELYHRRFTKEEFIKIAHEEMHFIRKDLSNNKKIVQIKYTNESAKWYPIAFKIMLKLMTDSDPVEFATELLMPFTVDKVRLAQDPWAIINQLDPGKYDLEDSVQSYNHYFEVCGCDRFAQELSKNTILDLEQAQGITMTFSEAEIKQAASFHGDIGEAKKTLDAKASKEQAKVIEEGGQYIDELKSLGQEYLKKFGFKFLISAKDKSAQKILEALKLRLNQSKNEEINEARKALWEISKKRLQVNPETDFKKKLKKILDKYNVNAASVAINNNRHTQSLFEGISQNISINNDTSFEIASLSKSIASCFAMEYFAKKNISLDTSVSSILSSDTNFGFKLDGEFSDELTIKHLLNHTALNMHYVNGFPLENPMPNVNNLLMGEQGYEPVKVLNKPGTKFCYSGAGYLLLQYLIEVLENTPAEKLNIPYLDKPQNQSSSGYLDDGAEVPGGRLNFPFFAAGMLGTPKSMAEFLKDLTYAYHNLEGSENISHDTAVNMLYAQDFGSMSFMGVSMGLGVFIGEAGENKLAIHQGANDGFRSLYLHCFDGPDQGKGFVIYANGDNNAVLLITELAKELIENLNFSGVDFKKLKGQLDFSNMKQEEIVNQGYKTLIFDAFEPCLPDKIKNRTKKSEDSNLNLVIDASITHVSNEKFARAENLISSFDPVFDPEEFCTQGKVMDSWETERHNMNPFHFLDLELKNKAPINYMQLSTEFHDGNHVEYVSLEYKKENKWVEFLEKTNLKGHALLKIKLPKSIEAKFIRVKAYPDGGLTRLGLYSEVSNSESFNSKSVRFDHNIPKPQKPLSLSYDKCNYKLVSASNEHYGPAKQVISPFPPIHMFDGFESARSRKKDHNEELVIELKDEQKIKSIVFDFKFFINNSPMALSIYGLKNKDWVELQPKTDVKAFRGNQKQFYLNTPDKFNQIQVKIYPDGGINRIKVT